MKSNRIHPWLLALLVLPLVGTTAEAQAPVVFKVSEGVRPNAIVSLYGEYGGCYDCVDAEAVSENTEGWYNWGRIGEMSQGAWHCPVYFNQLKRSTFTGISPAYSTMGITAPGCGQRPPGQRRSAMN